MRKIQTLLVGMHLAERSKNASCSFAQIYDKPDFLVAKRLNEIPEDDRGQSAGGGSAPKLFFCSPTRELQPLAWRLQSPSPASPCPTSIPAGGRGMKRRNRDGEVLPSGRGTKAARLEDVKMSDGPTGPGATFTTCEGGAAEPFIPEHRTNLLGWYSVGVGWRCGRGWGAHSRSLFPSVRARLRRTENIQSW